jgi:hydrogenase maturation protein HypF
MALSHLRAAGLDWDTDLPPVRACPSDELRVLEHQLRRDAGCTPTSSMGRLFDAVAALIGVRQVVDYEAQAAIELEGLSRTAEAGRGRCAAGTTHYTFTLDTDRHPLVFDPGPVLAAVIEDLRGDVPVAVIGARFHQAVADLIVALAEIRAVPGQPVVLSGGVFQNALLLRQTLTALHTKGFQVFTHRQVPPNDGGIALGQLLVGNAG